MTDEQRCPECDGEGHEVNGLECWKQQALNERHDVEMIAHEVSQVYAHITGDKLSKPNYEAQVVIDAADEHYRDDAGWTISDLLGDAVTTDGDHHKQWYLEQIAEAFGLKLPEHERGIAP